MLVRKLLKTGLAVLFIIMMTLCIGCVERKLTIVTEPAGALVMLNDEEIGTSPVTVGFEWYGDYSVRLTRQGYQTMNTHRDLKRPIRDRFPFDLFDDMFHTRIDAYTWNFKLEPYEAPNKEQLIDDAVKLRKEALVDPNGTADKVKKPKKPKPAKAVKDKNK